eukprot:6192859-Pleurochrysis_carterae.AAC.1
MAPSRCRVKDANPNAHAGGDTSLRARCAASHSAPRADPRHTREGASPTVPPTTGSCDWSHPSLPC